MEAVIVLGILGGIAWWLVKRDSGSASSTPKATPVRRTASNRISTPRASRSSHRADRTSARWLPLGETAAVQGLTLPGGFYLGEGLDAVSPARGDEPALINPKLPVDLRRPDLAGQQMGYWPSYTEIPSASRGAYLRWLADGRPAGAYIGYVFLFFYGIERRVILDASASGSRSAQDEIPGLLDEVERLLKLYGHNGSFQGYATNFLATARMAGAPKRVADLTPPRERVGWDIPLEVKLAVGALSADEEPLPAEWALAWALTSPEIPLRTPAARCPEEFAQLFTTRYSQAHGDGLRIKPNNSKLRLEYRPASASFGGAIELDSGGLPDVTRLTGPTKKIASLVSVVTDELDAFSRHVGRHDDRDSARAVALLPQVLAATRLSGPVASLLESVPADGHRLASAYDVAAILGTPTNGKLPKRDAAAIAALLSAHGIGVEPDIRAGTVNFSHHQHAVLWRDSEAASTPGDGFPTATVLLHLGVTVSASDGDVSAAEEQHLEASLESAFDLPPAGRRRLQAHLRWLLTDRPGIAGVKARLATADDQQRRLVARYLLAVAGADGHVSPKEIDSLRKLYGLLGLDPEAVHSDLHSMASSAPPPIVPADLDGGDFVLPAAPNRSTAVLLDERRLAEVMSSTEQVSQVLTAVFVADEPDPEPSPAAAYDEDTDHAVTDAIAGLDVAHTAFVRRLSAQPAWSRADAAALAEELGLLVAGAIESVNDAAFTISDGPLFEGDDPIELDGHVLKELLGA